MTRALSLLLGFLATTAWASEADRMIVVVPQAEYPDIVVIGNGWPADMTDGCLDRHECAPPKAGARVAAPAASLSSGGSQLSDIPTAPAGAKPASR